MNVSDGVTLAEALYVTIFSMLIVFAALAAIAGILGLFKYIGTEEKGNKRTQKIEKIDSVENTSNSSKDKKHFELEVAAIIAAIEEYSGLSADAFVVRNIRKIPNEMSSWAMSGRQGNVHRKI
ncbi:OadG family transporter subunit [Tuanshanicoccus lijuaniae]|uniref:OadG family transporter subunit n=1 Tax=Aerococcaceae bacterium zg-1292 TaxID=2774330 RepID=UPI001BD891C9|nr:OadG family protein [Aerococcaceae bacterium zg-A91]MBS4457459.1 OadG family protein [Aerococcaceae bacterium zg-BR33]